MITIVKIAADLTFAVIMLWTAREAWREVDGPTLRLATVTWCCGLATFWLLVAAKESFL